MVASVSCTLFALCFVILSSCTTFTYGVFCEEKYDAIAIKRTEITAHLHFYFHDILGGKHPTAVKIAGPPDAQEGSFGTTMMMDDLLTEGPGLSSKPVGRAQGIYGFAAQQDVALLMALNFVFTDGEYNGSSVSVLGRNPVMNDVREMPIVGGSGVFRLARGYALAHTVWYDKDTGDATVEYNMYVSHSESMYL